MEPGPITAGGTFLFVAAASSTQVAMEWIVLIGAAVAALGVIYAKVLRPISHGVKRTRAGVELIFELPERLDEIQRHLAGYDGRLRVVEQRVNAAAELASELRVEGAMDVSPLPRTDRRRGLA